MNKENRVPCIVFPMGMEAYPFLQRVEVRSRKHVGKAVYREVFLEGRKFAIIKCGIGPIKAAASIMNLTVLPSAIVSAGTAGALVEDLKVGNLVISSHTLNAKEPLRSLASSESLCQAVVKACRRESLPHRIATIATVTNPVFSRDERTTLRSVTSAVAVDMESHALALEAEKLGVPFVAVRAISDDMDCPPLAIFTKPRDLFGSPYELPAKLTALFRWRRFLKNLRFAVEVLHPALVGVIRYWDSSDRK